MPTAAIRRVSLPSLQLERWLLMHIFFTVRCSTSPAILRKPTPSALGQPVRLPASLLSHRSRKHLLNTVPKSCNVRSEEHTSELQSRFDLVCRLLLEKKK